MIKVIAQGEEGEGREKRRRKRCGKGAIKATLEGEVRENREHIEKRRGEGSKGQVSNAVKDGKERFDMGQPGYDSVENETGGRWGKGKERVHDDVLWGEGNHLSSIGDPA